MLCLPLYVSCVRVKDNNLSAVSTIVPSSCLGFCVIKPLHKIEQFGAQKENLFFVFQTSHKLLKVVELSRSNLLCLHLLV